MTNTALPGADTGRIAVIGLGYVGLPLAVEFGRNRPVTGFDVDAGRIAALSDGRDATREVDTEQLRAASHLAFTDDPASLADCRFYIVTVPTPVDGNNMPVLTPIEQACETIAPRLREGDVVIFESTVFPGCTAEVCVPILERASGLRHNADFFTGYSPERINPGDKQHRLPDIVKVTSGSTPQVATVVDDLYAQIITAGTHKAQSIEVAEASKVIENTQRDLNIALMNELSIIFERLGLDTQAVLDAAGTKWNFLRFSPGLVGGHCIGVDPYYLTYRAMQTGYHPEVVLAGRRINDGMAGHLANRIVRALIATGEAVAGARVLVLGLTFKEDCPDLRNSKVFDLIAELENSHLKVDAFDPEIAQADAANLDGVSVLDALPRQADYDAVILAVPHSGFVEMGAAALRGLGKPGAVFFDVKGAFALEESDGRL